MEVIFEEIYNKDIIPMDLLLLADPSEEMINKYLHNGRYFCANQDKEIIGILISLKTRPETVEIMNISIKPIHQNKGIGKRLIKFAIEILRKDNLKKIEIGTGNPGVHQMLLYQKCGFRIIGVDLDFFRKNYKDKIFENGIECRDMIRMSMEL